VTGRGQLREWLDALAALGGVVSALDALVATPDEVLFRHASGYRVGGEKLVAGAGARFDAASLTKPWVATLALVLDRDGLLPLDRRLPAAAAATHAIPPRLEDLLRHRAEMRAWAPLAVRVGRGIADRDVLKDFLLKEGRTGTMSRSGSGAGSKPDGESDATRYSDLGYLLWSLLAEEALDRSTGELLDDLVFAPLGLEPLAEISASPPNAVECRLDNGKEVELAAAQGVTLGRQRSFHLGVPQDGNARALRVAGIFPPHAGLFVTAEEMLELGREWLRPGRLLPEAQVRNALGGDGGHALGWARWSEDGSSGPALPASAFGHTGFTGGSLWIDPERERIYLFLAHRLSSAIDFNPFRREFHARAAAL